MNLTRYLAMTPLGRMRKEVENGPAVAAYKGLFISQARSHKMDYWICPGGMNTTTSYLNYHYWKHWPGALPVSPLSLPKHCFCKQGAALTNKLGRSDYGKKYQFRWAENNYCECAPIPPRKQIIHLFGFFDIVKKIKNWRIEPFRICHCIRPREHRGWN